MNRAIRRSIDIVLTIIGIVIIFSSAIMSDSLQVPIQIVMALIGVLMMEIGVWGMSSRFLPSERRYLELRSEGDQMIDLIRELNAAAIAKDRGEEDVMRFQNTLALMHESVKRMAELAALEKNL